VEAYFGSSAEAHTVGRDDHRTRAKLDRGGHSLKGADGEVDFVPLALLRGEEQLHEVGAHREVRRVPGDDEAAEVADSFAFGLEGLGDEPDDVVTDGVFLGVELDAGDVIADVDERGSRVLADDSVGLAVICNCGCAFWLCDRSHFSGVGVENAATGGNGRVFGVPGDVTGVD
jgi:hypothetical protein